MQEYIDWFISATGYYPKDSFDWDVIDYKMKNSYCTQYVALIEYETDNSKCSL